MKSYLGIELGSTRIKALALNEKFQTIFTGAHTWKSDCINGIWTYDLADAWKGMRIALAGLPAPDMIAGMGISGMMHGYLAFDQNWNLLVPFRTWQNTMTETAAAQLTELFGINIPQRWSIAHLYQAILCREPHVGRIAHITTLAGYIHFCLTGKNVIGIGDASGMFPIDDSTMDYNRQMLEKFDGLLSGYALPWHIQDLLPEILVAGQEAGRLTVAGANLLGNVLPAGIPLAPPEGDAGTGMTAANAVAPGTGNVSAGTSIFSMVVLEQPLRSVHNEIDLVTTPTGRPAAMVHCNNCTNDSNAWTSLFQEAAGLFGTVPQNGEIYRRLYEKSLEGEPDCGGIVVYNYLAGEGVTHLNKGCPMVIRSAEARFSLANFYRATLYSAMATLRIGMDILKTENVDIVSITGHGGLFKTPGVAQRYLAAACNTPVICMETSGEGGPYGMALLVAYMEEKAPGESLETYLHKVFANATKVKMHPDPADVEGFNRYIRRFQELLEVEKLATALQLNKGGCPME